MLLLPSSEKALRLTNPCFCPRALFEPFNELGFDVPFYEVSRRLCDLLTSFCQTLIYRVVFAPVFPLVLACSVSLLPCGSSLITIYTRPNVGAFDRVQEPQGFATPESFHVKWHHIAPLREVQEPREKRSDTPRAYESEI